LGSCKYIAQYRRNLELCGPAVKPLVAIYNMNSSEITLVQPRPQPTKYLLFQLIIQNATIYLTTLPSELLFNIGTYFPVSALA
jgi:hypothetical protein